mgnify:CR=1 FL=1
MTIKLLEYIMLSIVKSMALNGINGYLVEVETDVDIEVDTDEVDCEHCDDYNCLSNPHRFS